MKGLEALAKITFAGHSVEVHGRREKFKLKSYNSSRDNYAKLTDVHVSKVSLR
jgi:hypothetical protein